MVCAVYRVPRSSVYAAAAPASQAGAAGKPEGPGAPGAPGPAPGGQARAAADAPPRALGHGGWARRMVTRRTTARSSPIGPT
jgi:hypothetical protein